MRSWLQLVKAGCGERGMTLFEKAYNKDAISAAKARKHDKLAAKAKDEDGGLVRARQLALAAKMMLNA